MWDIQSFKPIFDFELRHVNPQDREDIMQTALLKLFIALKNKRDQPDEYLNSENVGGLLRTIARCTVIDYYRKRKNLIEANSFAVHWNDGYDEKSHSGSTKYFHVSYHEHGYEVSEIRNDYYTHRERFTPQEKRVIDYLLEEMEGAGELLSEISVKLNVHKSHATRALQKLRKICHTR